MSDSKNVQLLKHLIGSPEMETIEFKMNNSDHSMIGQIISGLANSACLGDKDFGYLIYGVADNDRSIQGTSFKPSEVKVGNEEIINWIANRLSPKIDFRIKEIELDQKKLVVFEVPAATVQPVTFDRTAYIRIGSANRRLSDFPEKERLIWKSGDRYVFEKDIALEGVTGDQVLSLLDFST